LPRFGTHVVHPRPQSRARKGGQAPELPPDDAALVRAVDPYDDELYAWALRRHASCGSPADARPSY
jgi:hypothetical protein